MHEIGPQSSLIKTKTKFSSYIRKFRWDRLQVIYVEELPNVHEEMRKYLTIYEEAVSYVGMTLQLIPSEFHI